MMTYSISDCGDAQLGTTSATAPCTQATPRGMFVALEGLDGAGKTTAVRELARRAEQQGLPLLAIEKKQRAFSDPVVHAQLEGLYHLLWADWAEDPFYRLGPLHWAYLMAGWFATIDHVVVEPALAEGRDVVVDSWMYKFMARLGAKRLVPEATLAALFGAVRLPDLVVRLEVCPSTALARKTSLTIGEAGNPKGGKPTPEGFLAHQAELAVGLDRYAAAGNWVSLDAGTLTPAEVGDAVLNVMAGNRRFVAGNR